MEKRVVIWAFLIVVLILSFSVIHAEENDSSGISIERLTDAEKLEGFVENISNEGSRSNYLRQEWQKLLEGSVLGEMFSKIDEFFSLLDPFFEMVLGVGFSFSGMFFITLFLWILLIDLGINLSTILELYVDLKNSNYYKWGAFIMYFIVVSSIRIARFFAGLIVDQVSKAGHWAVQIVLSVAIIVGLVILFKLSLTIKHKLRDIARNKKIIQNKEEIEEQKEGIDELKKNKKRQKAGNDEDREIEEQARSEIEGISEED